MREYNGLRTIAVILLLAGVVGVVLGIATLVDTVTSVDPKTPPSVGLSAISTGLLSILIGLFTGLAINIAKDVESLRQAAVAPSLEKAQTD